MTQYEIRSQSGRPVITCTNERRAWEILRERQRLVPSLRMFRVERVEKEIAA